MNENNRVINELEEFKARLIELKYPCFKQDFYIERFVVFEQYLNKEILRAQVIEQLNLSVSQVKKIRKKIELFGFGALIHKLKGIKRAHKFDDEVIEMIIKLYNGEYARESNDSKFDFSESNYSHFHRHLTGDNGDLKHFGIKISLSTLARILNKNGFVSVAGKRARDTHDSKGKRLGRVYLPGERWEMDGTFDDWLGDGKVRCAHAIYDRGLEAPVAIYIGDEETTYGYYMAFMFAVGRFGLPQYVVADNRSTFYNVGATEPKFKYDTRFNNMLDRYRIKYDFSSNSNAKPGVEAFNNDLKTNFISDVRRHGMKTVEELNSYAEKYISFKQKPSTSKRVAKFNRKVSSHEFKDYAYISKDERVVQKKGRVIFGTEEYELFKNDELRQLSKGTKVSVTKALNGKQYAVTPHSRYEMQKAIEVEEKQYNRIEVKKYKRSIQENGCIKLKGIEHIILKNNGKHLELETSTKVEIQEKLNGVSAFVDKKKYSVCEKSEYAFKHKIKPRKYCSVRLLCMVRYDGDEYILVDEHKKIAYQTDDVSKLYIKYHLDGLTAFNGDEAVARLLPKTQYTQLCGLLPNSRYQAKRYREISK